MKRPTVKGKFIYKNGDKLYLKGVTYGTFEPREGEIQFPEPHIVQKDLSMMVQHGFNCVRTYTVPPLYLLDTAASLDINVMVGLPWEQHITFLDTTDSVNSIIKRVKNEVHNCNAHPAILCYTIGNEIPAGIVRWHGKEKIEQFLHSLYKAVKSVDPECLVTYVNYPTTEYLDLKFLDFDCFNVYLETPQKLSSYISRLHNLSGDKPLVLAEIGLDSRRNGEMRQAQVLQWQVRTIFEKGCAGIFIFSWTDEWWRGGFEIEDWDFGLVDRDRYPKPALKVVSTAMKEVPYVADSLPFISIVVCTYNGSSTIRDTLEASLDLDYPNYEIIVINDGSTDKTPEIVKRYPVRLINCPNAGLSAARNKGLQYAQGEIIAYIDDDAYPDPQWLRYLAHAYANSDHACIGGPNIAPDDDGFLATCVANAPGGPVHVLLNDELAEHVPGCNMSFRKDALKSVKGFDPIFRTAGDDVDVCWRIQNSGKTIGFHPGAVVWHHRRNSLRAYWKQQKGYGKAEALLEAKWPEKYNSLGHLEWAGRIYGNGLTIPIATKKQKIFHGKWGSSLFQSIYQPSHGMLNYIPLMPEWYLVIFTFLMGGLLGFIWSPLLWSWPLFFGSLLLVVGQASASAEKNSSLNPTQRRDPRYKLMIIALHIMQPVARLYGRFIHGLTPWRSRGEEIKINVAASIRSRTFLYWTDQWKPVENWLSDLEQYLFFMKTRIKRGGEFDNWDLQVNHGLFSKARALLVIEEHGAQKQYLKLRCWTLSSSSAWVISIALLLTGVIACFANQWIVAGLLFMFSGIIIQRCFVNQARSMHSLQAAFAKLGERERAPIRQTLPQELLTEYKNGNGNGNANGNGHLQKKNGHLKPLEVPLERSLHESNGSPVTGVQKSNNAS